MNKTKETTEKKTDLDIVGAIWRKSAKKSGIEYFSMRINAGIEKDTNLIIFENKKMKSENSPHFLVFKDTKTDTTKTV